MAIFRPIQISFWQDPFVVELTPEEKYFYIYLMTNSKTSQCGIYEIAKRVIEMETGYSRDSGVIDRLINKFVDYKKILYNNRTTEIFLLNWLKYNPINNRNIEKRVFEELKEVKTQDFIPIFLDKIKELKFNTPIIDDGFKGLNRGYNTPTKKPIPIPQPIPTPTSNNIVEETINYTDIINYLNQKAKTNYRSSSKKTKDLIKARFNDKFTYEDFYKVIDNKCLDWLGSEMEKYLRPETIFGPKFETYLNQKVIKGKQPHIVDDPEWLKQHQQHRQAAAEDEEIDPEELTKKLKQLGG